VQYRRVKTGRLYEGLRIIREGLDPKDRVIVAGSSGVGPGTPVSPEEVQISTGTPAPQGTGKTEAAPANGTTKAPGGERSKE